MCKQMNLEELCRYVLHQVPEADPADVRHYALTRMQLPCDPSDAYDCARVMEAHLILKGSV